MHFLRISRGIYHCCLFSGISIRYGTAVYIYINNIDARHVVTNIHYIIRDFGQVITIVELQTKALFLIPLHGATVC